MKIAIVSDMHIGYARFYDDAYSQAREALKCARENADAVLVAGDIFDKRNPPPEVMAQAINLFRDFSKNQWNAKVKSFTSHSTLGEKGERTSYTNVPIIAISGTHERLAEGKENALNILGLAGLLVDTSEATTIIQKDDELVSVFGLGGLSEERVGESLKNINPRPIDGMFSIFMFHQSIYEILPFNDQFIKYEDLPKGFDLYVDGHIHSFLHEKVHGKSFIIPGSTVLTQLKDSEQQSKGVVIFDTKTYSYKFIEINSRKFISKKIVADGETPQVIKAICEKEIENLIGSSSATKPILKIKVEGKLARGSYEGISLIPLTKKYQESIYLEIDTSKLSDPNVESRIEEIRESKIDEMSIKELGMALLSSKLKEAEFDNHMDYRSLFNIFSGDSGKEKIMREAMISIFGKQSEP